jgi:tetratricopeptide (TPR) repeat protein
VSIAVAAGIFGVMPVMAQPTGDRVLSRASVTENERCALIDVKFNYPLRLITNFPTESGNQVLIRLQPVDGATGMGALRVRETLSAPRSALANVRDIEFDGTSAAGLSLTIIFAQPVFFRIGQNPDFQNLVLAVSGRAQDSDCTPQTRIQPPATPTAPARQPPPPAPLPEGAPGTSGNALLEQARAAITSKDYETAIRLLTKLLAQPESPATQDAQELLGVVRERNGQLAHAKAEYEEYLRRYPKGEGADRVRQRLAALLRNALNPPKPPGEGAGGKPAVSEEEEPEARWFLRGSISEYYYHDQMKTVVKDDITHVVIDDSFTTLQSELVSALDTEVGVTTDSLQAKLRISAARNTDFLPGRRRRDDTLVAQLYLEGATADRRLLGRVGRQYRSAGGLIGRIDGLLLSYQPMDHLRADIIAGFPVDSSRAPFDTGRKAYGASMAYLNGPWYADIYAMRQMDHGFLDRQPIGLEARYAAGTSSYLGILEYDSHFSDFNTAIFNGTTVLPTKTIVNVALDYRRSPILRTSNALIGQPVRSLDQLLSTYTDSEIHQLALDRTAKSKSVFISLTQPFNERYSAGLDATIWNLSGSPASGGVPEIPAMGTEYYYSAHFLATSLIMEGDLAMATVGYTNSYNAQRYTLDLNTRYPLMHDLRVGPRLFGSFRQTTGANSTERYLIRPTLRMNYRLRRNVELEFEGGAEWEKDILRQMTIRSWNFVTNFGVRVDF